MSERSKRPTVKQPQPPPPRTSEEIPTVIYDSGNFRKEAATPIRAISMKDAHAQAAAVSPPADAPTPVVPRPRLRAMSELTPPRPAQNLGHIAPPYDPKEARARTVREYVMWGCVAIMLASVIALAVWFAAR